jgi:Tol biopolymer transport system component
VPHRDIAAGQAIAPDGQWIAYTAGGSLWLRKLSAAEAREVPGSDGAVGPFWSPRSDAVVFAVGDRLMKASILGGQPEELCPIAGGDFTGGAWSETEGIVFTLSRANWDGDVLRVPEEGGVPEVYTEADESKGERRLHSPHFLPDGRTLIYSAVTYDDNGGELVIDQDGTRSRVGIGNRVRSPFYSPTGQLLFTRYLGEGDSLWAVPFSLESMSATGEPKRLVDGGDAATAARDGTLLYGLRKAAAQQLVWVDRTGTELGTIGEPMQSTLWTPAISPDGRYVAATLDWREIEVWDTDRSVHTRMTDDDEYGLFAEWAPGGEEVVYSLLSNAGALAMRRFDGSGAPRVLLRLNGVAAPSFSRDGRYLAFYVVDPVTKRDLWAAETSKLDEPFPLLQTPANEAMPRVSPDGKFLAYQSDVSGRWEIYLQPFPRGEGRWQVSVDGGQHVKWSSKGDELFFVSGNDLMSVEVSTDGGVRVGVPKKLFSGADVGTRLSQRRLVEGFYDVAPDGERFVVVKGVREGTNELVLTEGLLD